MKFAVLNQSAAPDDAVEMIATAMRWYLGEVCDAWELAKVRVEYFGSRAPVAPYGYVPAVALNSPDAAGALGYHALDPEGRPYMRSFLDVIPNRVVLADPFERCASLAAVMLHEAAETAVDVSAALYQDVEFRAPDGQVYDFVALEVCDPVQEYSKRYKVDGSLVEAPDFVLPDWFGTEITKGNHVDWLRKVSKPLELGEGGYVIVADRRGRDTSLFAAPERIYSATPPAMWRRGMQLHGASRNAQRSRHAMQRRFP